MEMSTLLNGTNKSLTWPTQLSKRKEVAQGGRNGMAGQEPGPCDVTRLALWYPNPGSHRDAVKHHPLWLLFGKLAQASYSFPLPVAYSDILVPTATKTPKQKSFPSQTDQCPLDSDLASAIQTLIWPLLPQDQK